MRRTAGWALTAVLLVVGLLGMHGLASGHGSAAAPEAVHLAMVMDHVVEGDALAPVATAMTHPACVAVLGAGLLQLLLALVRSRLRLPGAVPQGLPVRVPSASARAPDPPDLVAGLCVSRT